MGNVCFKEDVTISSEYLVRYHSTRMKKVAPPPPPIEKAPPPPPLSNGNIRRTISAPAPAVSGGPRPTLGPVLSTPGEDCAIDELLEGRMDLEVVLPDFKVVRMTVDRKTPMMDLLVQATTSNKISPGGHVINLISKDERNVPYQPNTPIGALDVNTVYIIPKSTLDLPVKRMPKLANQPFEQTFRLQVNLPLNQRMVLRVSPRITLSELKQQICAEKELDLGGHHLVHPAQPDTVLDLNATLELYGCAEISLMSNAGLRDSIRNTATYITQPPRLEEEKRKKGILRLFSRRKREFTTEIPANGVNQLPSSQSDSATLNRNSYQPKQSVKRKQAPAPPPIRNSSPPLITQSSNSLNSRPESEISVKTADEIESSVSHSRHSSDSSGYHEPSIFSDCSENKSPEASIVHGDHGYVSDVHRQGSPLQKDNSDNSVQMKKTSMTTRDSNLKNVPSCSNVSISSVSRKRKAPQPPSTLPAIESPSSPDAPPIDLVENSDISIETKTCEASCQVRVNLDISPENNSAEIQTVKDVDSNQQESEALQYLEDVLQESDKLPSPKILDDSDTDSLKDEGQMISVCQAEVHANASDHDSPDSVVESQTVVASAPESHKFSLSPQSNPISQTAGYEVVDASADDSGISQSLNSDADSSVPSLNSDYKTMSDSGCQEDIYCNVTESEVPKLVPSEIELPGQSSSAETVNTQNYESSVCDGTSLTSDRKSFGEDEQLLADREPILTDINATVDSTLQKNTTFASEATLEQKSNSLKQHAVLGDRSCVGPVSSRCHQNSTTVIPQCKKKLDNFVLSSYKKDEMEDIYSAPTNSSAKTGNNSCLLNNSDEKYEVEVPKRKLKSHPDVKIVSLKEEIIIDAFKSEENAVRITGKCAQLNKISTLPLTGRCSSMYNLTPQKVFQKTVNDKNEELVIIDEGMKRTQSDQNFESDLQSVDLKACFLQEQRRLQEEYQRLQAQFISWQKQLMNNQSLLQNENILPPMPFTSLVELEKLGNSPEKLDNSYRKTISEKQLTSNDENVPFDQYKTRSLPRPKKNSLSLKEPTRPKTPPVPSNSSETSVIDIDIGSEVVKRPETLKSCSVDTQADMILEDKVTQIPSPQDKTVQVPTPPDKVTSGTQVPSPETVKSKEDVSAQTSNQNLASPTDSSYSDSEGSKSQTLPRPKPKPVSAFQHTQTMTLNRKSMPKPQAVSVTIGSWQQRQTAITDIESANVASSRSKFQSLENIPQSSIKSVPSFMEKRKLPPVPTDETFTKNVSSKGKTSETAYDGKFSKIIKESTKPSGKSTEKSVPHVQSNPAVEETAIKTVWSANKTKSSAVSKPDETAVQKQKIDIKLAAKEPTAMFKSVKPFIKLSSMKDESHAPSIIGLRKWPLSDISENKSTEGKQSIIDDLKASSKQPGGLVQEKIRRAEVDLRKPKLSKSDSTASKTKEANTEAIKIKPVRATEISSETEAKKIAVEPSKLHITKVSITSVKSNANPKPDEKKYTSNVTTPVSAPNNTTWANTIPKSLSLNSELLAAFSKKANKDVERYKEIGTANVPSVQVQSIKVNGSVQSPPPPPPLPVQSSNSTMPTIPPAEQIPVSSQLLMARESATACVTKKNAKKNPTKFSRTTDPREELMLEIRSFGGKQALRKIPTVQPGWHLQVFGTASTANS